MNSPNNQDWNEKIEELEQEIETKIHQSDFPKYQNSLKQWFRSLPPAGRIAVYIGGIVVGFSLLSTVLKVISSFLSIAILAIVICVLYKLFLAENS